MANRTLLHILLLLAVGAAIFLPKLGTLNLIEEREPRHAEIAREMVVSGNWLVPQFCGRPYVDKPPLFNWSIAALFALTGRVDFGMARLPSVLSGLAALLGVYALGRRWFNPRTALWAALIMAMSEFMIVWARTCRMDLMMASLILYATLLADMSAASGGRRSLWLWLAASVVIGGAVLSKGPQALFFFAVPAVMAWRIRRGRWVPPLTYILSVLVTAIILFAAWALPAEVRHPGHMRELFGYQFGAGLHEHTKRFYLYVDQLLLGTAPWSIFVFGAAHLAVRRLRRAGLEFASAAALTVAIEFLVLTATPNRREHYLLPLLPVWSLLLAWFMDQATVCLAQRGDVRSVAGVPDGILFRRGFLWPLAGLLVLSVAAGITGAVAWVYFAHSGVAAGVLVMLLVAALAVAGLIMLRRHCITYAVGLLFASALVASAGLHPMLSEGVFQMVKKHEQMIEIAQTIPREGQVAAYDVHHEFLYFQLNRPVVFAQGLDDLGKFLEGDGIRYVITQEYHAQDVVGLAPRPIFAIHTWRLETITPITVTVLKEAPAAEFAP
jgi:4-amino-4-deoxy-L-arabinose transferase-like glycosyltransferase